MKSLEQMQRATRVEQEIRDLVGGTWVGPQGLPYDISDVPGRGKVEVKNDEESARTGNFVFEFSGNYGKPSGLAITQADEWFQVSGDLVYVFDVAVLREQLSSWKFNNCWVNSDEGASSLRISILTAKSWAKEVLKR